MVFQSVYNFEEMLLHTVIALHVLKLHYIINIEMCQYKFLCAVKDILVADVEILWITNKCTKT